jgi:hypothetical protein
MAMNGAGVDRSKTARRRCFCFATATLWRIVLEGARGWVRREAIAARAIAERPYALPAQSAGLRGALSL